MIAPIRRPPGQRPNVLASDSVYGIALHKFADLIQEKSGGAITIEVYDAGSLGAEKECMEGLQMGTVDFWVGSTATCSNFTDSQTIYDLPYLFQNAEIAREVLQGETCQGILDQMSEVSVKGLCYFENGIYAIISKDPIETLDDMKGKKIRAVESNLQTDTYAALGATALPSPGATATPPCRPASATASPLPRCPTCTLQNSMKSASTSPKPTTAIVPACLP